MSSRAFYRCRCTVYHDKQCDYLQDSMVNFTHMKNVHNLYGSYNSTFKVDTNYNFESLCYCVCPIIITAACNLFGPAADFFSVQRIGRLICLRMASFMMLISASGLFVYINKSVFLVTVIVKLGLWKVLS